MIIAKKKVRTNKELFHLFKKLDAEGFKWATGSNLIEPNLRLALLPQYIYIHNQKFVTHFGSLIPESDWGNF